MRFIGDAVIRGEFAPGEALPEVPMAKRLQTSRGTVREALRALQELGLIEIKAHRGAFVSELSVGRAEEIISLRTVLESWAARLTVERGLVTDELAGDLEAALSRLQVAADGGDTVAVMEATMDFHHRIAEAPKHVLLLEQLTALQAQTRQAAFYAHLYDDAHDVVEDHRRLLDAMRTGDPAHAAGAMRAHIEASGRMLLSRMANLELEGPLVAAPR